MFKDLISKIPTEYLPQISDYVKVILPIIATYIITKYSLSSPKRILVMEKQFEYVYLPLYKYYQFHINTSEYSKTEIVKYSKYINKVLYKNYEYVFPQLHTLSKQLMSELNSDKDYSKTLQNIIYKIEFDYERLKRNLGYPAETIFQSYLRLRRVDKFHVIISILLAIDVFFLVEGFMVFIVSNNGWIFYPSALLGCILYFLYRYIR